MFDEYSPTNFINFANDIAQSQRYIFAAQHSHEGDSQ
jgi:hypothetical protein